MELQRVSENNARFNELSAEYRSNLEVFMDDEARRALESRELPVLLADNNPVAMRVFGKYTQQNIYRYVLLHSISDLWIEQLTRMEALRISIGMEAYAQQDPLVQYKSQSTDAFKNLFADIRMGVISRMFRLQPAPFRSRRPKPSPPPRRRPASPNPRPARRKKARKSVIKSIRNPAFHTEKLVRMAGLQSCSFHLIMTLLKSSYWSI